MRGKLSPDGGVFSRLNIKIERSREKRRSCFDG